MRYVAPAVVVESKAEAQQRFLKQCANQGLSAKRAASLASFIPFELAGRMRVVAWPKIR